MSLHGGGRMEPGAVEIVRGVIRSRRSVRSGYTGEPIPANVLRDILEAGVYAPTGSNSQGVRLLPVLTRKGIERFAGFRPGLSPKASAFIVVLATPAEGFWSKLAPQDCAAAIENMALMATAHGIASCWFSAFRDMDGTHRMLGHSWRELIGETPLQPFGILQLGYSPRMSGDVSHRGRPVKRSPLDSYLVGSAW